MDNNLKLKDYWHLSIRIIILLTVLVLLFFFIKNISWVISLLVIATLIVYCLSPIADFLTKRGIPNTLAVIFVFLLLLISFLLFFYFLIPEFIMELGELARFLATDYRYLLPEFVAELNTFLEIDSINQALQNFANDLVNNLPSNLQTATLQITRITRSIVSHVVDAVLVLFLVFYLLRDLKAIKKGIISIFPKSWRKEAIVVLSTVDSKVGAYLRGNILLCLVVGILTGVALRSINMPFSLMLGILAGVLNIIVYVGPWLAGIPAVLLALTPNAPHPLLVISIYIVVQAIDAFILTPLLLGKAVDLMPISVIVSLLVGGQLFGLLGVLLAIPVTATLKVLIYYYLHGNDEHLSAARKPPPALAHGYQRLKKKVSALIAKKNKA